MSIKDLFGKRSNQIITLADADKLEQDVESIEYADIKVTDDMKFVPRVTVDFDNPKTFAKYGSAAKYYEDSLINIINTYPYDGSDKEKLHWHNKATYIDNWIFENKYPRTTGYISLNTNNIVTSTTTIGTYNYKTFSSSQYVTLNGGPHKSDVNANNTLAGEFAGNGNIVDSEKSRESNLNVDPSVGVTIEFWWKKESTTETGIECLFYLTNGITIGTTDWARLMIEHDDIWHNSNSTTGLFLTTLQSEAGGASRLDLGIEADLPSGLTITNWNHYAIVIKNNADGTNTDASLYINGEFVKTVSGNVGTQSSTFKLGNGLQAAIGAYIDDPSTAGGFPAAPFGATRSKFDEFRFWKKARTAEEIGRHWFTQVAGGTNTDDANVDLGVYYKFNEGILNTEAVDATDSTVLDYSGRLSNGVIVNYNLDVRSTASAVEEYDSSLKENKDPIMYPQHFDFLELFQDLVVEGQMHDKQNNSAIYRTLPEWIISEDEEDGRRELKKLTQVVASYFDTLHLQIEALPKLGNATYTQDGEKPLPFAKKLLESVGFVAPELFVDATIMESLADRNETMVFEEKISNVKNLIYQNIYNNITHIYKSKGTEKSFRNLLRCFGVGDDLVKINLYGDGVTFKLKDNYKSASVRKNYLDYNHKDRYQATCYQYAIDSNSTSFIAGSTTNQFDYIPFTLEADVIIPSKMSTDHDSFSPITFSTSSMFGMHEADPASDTPSINTDLTWHGTDDCGLSVQAIKTDGTDGTDAKFRLITTAAWGATYTLDSPTYKDVYSNQRWNFAVRLRPTKANADIADGTIDTTYTLEFYGVNVDLDIVQEEFTVTQVIGNTEGKAALNASKRIFAGSEYQNSTGTLVNKTDVKIGSIRYWLDYLDDETIKDHARDVTNYGAKRPSRSAYTQTSTHPYDVLQADTLALYWNFETAAIPQSDVDTLVPATGSVTITNAAAGLIGDYITITTTDNTTITATADASNTTTGHTLNPTFKVATSYTADPADVLYHFNSDSSSAPVDATGNTTGATYEGDATLASQSPTHFDDGDSSVYFDGSTTSPFDSVDIPYPASLDLDGAFTIDFWVKFDDVTAAHVPAPWYRQVLFGSVQDPLSGDNSIGVYLQSNSPSAGDPYSFNVNLHRGSDNSMTTADMFLIPTTNLGSIQNDVWYHIAVTRDGSDVIRLFVNGEKDDVYPSGYYQAGYSDLTFNQRGALRIGRGAYAGAAYYSLKGYIDEFRIVKGQTLWTTDFSSTFSGNEPGPYSLVTTYDTNATATNLASCLEANDLLSASSASGLVTIVQATGGSAGDKAIVLSDSTYMSKVDFTGGETTLDLTRGAMDVEDVSSGSLAATSSLGFLGPALKNRFTGKGDFYYHDDKKFVDRNFIFTLKQQLPEIISSSDTIKVLTEDDEIFTKEARPINHFWAIEKSMYQTVSDEMINLFASISDFNNMIGNPVNRYRMEYKELGKLRQIFFDRIGDSPNIEKYIEFYKWLDSSVNEMIQQLIPASANFSEGMRTMIESHILERNKYWTKFPTLESKGKIPETSMLGINELFYNWRIGHATVTEGENSLWWKDRTERDNSVIASGNTAIDEERDNILHVATTQVTGSWMDRDLKSSSGSYKGSTYALRNLSRPHRLSGNKEPEAEDIISPVSITNVPSPPPDFASFGEQHEGTFVENPTSVINNQLGNYRFPYDVVQTSGKKNNNSWFNSSGGLGSSILTSSESATVYGHYDFIPEIRTPKKHVFVERFSAPGSADTMQRGMLDVEGEEYSAYNSLNFRNLDVRLALGEWLTNHHATSRSPSFHKINKNTRRVRQTDETCADNYDNYWVQHPIPQSGHQYSWINSSVQSGTDSLQAQACPQGFATDYENLAPQYPAIETNPSSANYGLSVGTIKENGFPFLNAFQSWDKEKHANSYELVRTIDKDGEEIAKDNYPLYWSGSNILGDDILSNDDWIKYESGTFTLNELMLHRNGPYQHPSWKQIRNAENPAVVAMRNNNIISLLDKESEITNSDGTFIQSRSTNTVNYIEPAVTWNKPIVHRVGLAGSSVDADLISTYKNNLESFSNPYLAARLDYKKSTKQMYDILKSEYLENKGNITLKELKYSEYIFPKQSRTGKVNTRSREQYAEKSGITANGYDRNSSDIRTFWRDKPLDRQRTLYDSEYHTKTATNALGARVRNSSVWALDYFKYMSAGVGEDCSTYVTSGIESINSSSYIATMRGDLAWAGFAQHRGFVYEGKSLDVKTNDSNGRPSEDASYVIPPRPTLQFIHNPNSLKAKEEGWAWKTGELSGNAPWSDSYLEYSKDINIIGKNSSLLSEFKISDHMSFYIDKKGGDFTADNPNFLALLGVDKVVATSSYYFSYDGAENNEVTKYVYERNFATGNSPQGALLATLSKGVMHNTSLRDINIPLVQEPSADIDSLSNWKSNKAHPVTQINTSAVTDLITPDTKSLNMLSKNKDQWMSADLDVGFSSSEFKLAATKTAWEYSLATSRGVGIPVGYSPVSGGSWSDDHHWDQWENTFLMSFWVNLDKDGLDTTKAAGQSIGCISLHDSNPDIIPSDFFGLDDTTLKEVYSFDSVDDIKQSLTDNSMLSPRNALTIASANHHSRISQKFYDTDRLNKEELEKTAGRLKNKEIFTQMHSEKASFYLSDIADANGRACWVDTIGNKVYFNISPYVNLTDSSTSLAPGQWNHVSILYLGGTATDDSTNMNSYDARHHRVFLWVNNKLISSEVPSSLTSAVGGIETEHSTNGTLHQYIDRVNTKKITSFGGVKGGLTFGKCDPSDPRRTSAFSYDMNSAVLPGKISDFALVRGEIGLVQDPEEKLSFSATTTGTTYNDLQKWDWLFNNELAYSTYSKMESSLIKDLYRYQSKDINTVVNDWKTKNISSTTVHTTTQTSSAGTSTSNTAAGATSQMQNQVVSTTTYAENPPTLFIYWKMGIPSWSKTLVEVDDEDFLDSYSYTDGVEYFNNIINDHSGVKLTPVMRLEIEAVKKLIPYNGFYPSQRATQLGNLFYESLAPNVVGENDSDPWQRARTEQALLQPLFAPGILFNSFKSGIAVDWPGYTGEYSSNKIDLRDGILGSFSMVEEESNSAIEVLKRTRTGRVVLEAAMKAISRDVQSERATKEKIKELFPKYIERAKMKIGKEAQRFYKSATTIANFSEFEKWASVNGKNIKSKSALKEFAQINNLNPKDIKSNKSLDITNNIASIIGKNLKSHDVKKPSIVDSIMSNIVGSIGRISHKNIMYGNFSRIGVSGPMSERSELDLEGTYLDREPNIRIPFEGLISPSGYLPKDKKMFYLSPSNYLERFEVGNWNLDDSNQDRNLYNNLRYPYFKWSGKKNALYELAMHNFISEIPNFFLKGGNLTTFTSRSEDKFKPVEAGKSYYMDINLFKSSGFDMTVSPHDGSAVKIYNNLADEDELVDKDGGSYTTQGRYYGPALRCKSKGVARSEKFYIEDPAQAPYTPPYFYGTATARLVYRPLADGKPTLEDIHRRTVIEYINEGLDDKFASKTGVSGSSNNWKNTPAYRGRMPVESSMNLFGKTRVRDINYSVSGAPSKPTIKPIEASDSDKFAWTIQTKFESPVLNFNTSANKDVRTYGLDSDQSPITSLDIGESPCSTNDNRNVYGAVERDPRGVGLWSGYGEVPIGKDGLFVEIVNPSKEELSRTTVESEIDTTPYIAQLSIKPNCKLLSDGATIILRDPYGLKEFITIGQPSDPSSISLAATASYAVANIFDIDKGELLYHKKSKIRTIYTSPEATEDDHMGAMAGEFDIEAFFGSNAAPWNRTSGIPKSSDIANAICYHINYRFEKESDFNWTARVKWVDRSSRRSIFGASKYADNMKHGVDNLSSNFMTEGAVVELEWSPNYKVFKNISWRTNNPKLYDVPSATVEFNPTSVLNSIRSQKAIAFYERSMYDNFGTSGNPKYSRFNDDGWFPFYDKVLSTTDELEAAGSLADICGFETSSSRVGEIADSKVISEAIVMIPYIPSSEVNRNTQNDTLSITSAKLSLVKNNSSYAPTIKFGDKDFFKISRPLIAATAQKLEAGEPMTKDSPTTSISDMIKKMQKYNIPPMYDFAKNPISIDPFVMYIFEFEETLSKQDLADIWQGLMPKCAKAATKFDSVHPENKQVIEHELNDINFFEGKRIPDNIRWMTFKVKRKANIDYYKLTADSSDDPNFSFDLGSGKNKPDYSYNWPYDYFSLVELSKISGGVSIMPDAPPEEKNKKVKVKTGDLIPEDITRVSQREDARLLTDGSDEK